MVQQARLVAAVLGDAPQIDVAFIERAFARLERRTEARLQVFDAQGALVADSRDTPVPVALDSRTEYQTVAAAPRRPCAIARCTSSVPGWRIYAKKSAHARDPGYSSPNDIPSSGSRPAESGSEAGARGTLWRIDPKNSGPAVLDDGERAAGAARRDRSPAPLSCRSRRSKSCRRSTTSGCAYSKSF